MVNDKLEALVADHLDRVFPAMTLMVIQAGEVKIHRAWGFVDPETRRIPVTLETLFDLASVTKLFTVSTFLSLVSAGKSHLDDPLVSVIPEFGVINPRPIDGGQDPHTRVKFPIPEDKKGKTVDPTQVTFRHLLTHTSGLAPWRDVYNSAGLPPQPPDRSMLIPRETRWANALHALYRYPFVGFPGEKVRYSDLGLMLLGEAVSRLHTNSSGKIDEAIRELVTQPLGLASVIFDPLRNGIPREQVAPTEYDLTWRKRRCWGEVHDENACGVGGIAGHAGLFASVEDVAQFGQAWLSLDPRLQIEKSLMQEAITEQIETDGERRGLGWILKARENSSMGGKFALSSYGHTGFTGTSLFIEPERELVVATLTNRVYPGRQVEGITEFRQKLHDIIAEAADS